MEAVNFIDKKCSYLTSLSDTLTQDGARIKAHIKLVLEVSFILFVFVIGGYFIIWGFPDNKTLDFAL